MKDYYNFQSTLILVMVFCASLLSFGKLNAQTCTADAGTLIADVTPVQQVGGSANISASPDMLPNIPTNYEVLYVLTTGPNLRIRQTGTSPMFTVFSTGTYTIHTLVAELSDATDSNFLDTSVIVPGTTTGGDVLGIITGAGICASLDVAGAPIDVIDTLSVDENELADSLNFYPNPVQNELTIKNSRGIQINTIELFDISGRRVKNILVNQNNTNMNINLSDLSNGVYIINIISDNGQLSKRLIKK